MPVTVYDPLGTPTYTYSRDGRAILPVSNSTPNSFAAATKITKLAGETIAMTQPGGSYYLDSAFEVGDVVYIFNSGTIYVFDSGGTLLATLTTTWRLFLSPSGWENFGL